MLGLLDRVRLAAFTYKPTWAEGTSSTVLCDLDDHPDSDSPKYGAVGLLLRNGGDPSVDLTCYSRSLGEGLLELCIPEIETYVPLVSHDLNRNRQVVAEGSLNALGTKRSS